MISSDSDSTRGRRLDGTMAKAACFTRGSEARR